MVEFNTASYIPMDRKYHEPMQVEPVRSDSNIEKPVIPLIELGTTVPETDPAGRFKNVLQGVQANIRRGAGRIQLVMQTPHNQAIGGRPKAYGPEVREQLREVFKANEAMLVGVEMPTSSLTNLSGFDGRQGKLTRDLQEEHLDEIRDAIKFAADVGEGGGVDLVAFEFPRPIFDARWNEKDSKTGKQIFQDTEDPTVWLVDKRTGGIQQIPRSTAEQIPVALDKETGQRFEWNPLTQQFEIEKNGKVIKSTPHLQPLTWNDYSEIAKKKGKTAEEVFINEMKSSDKQQALGMAAYHERQAESLKKGVDQAKEIIAKGRIWNEEARRWETIPPEVKEKAKEKAKADLKRLEPQYKAELGHIQSYRVQAQRVQNDIDNTKPLNTFAKQQSIRGYAEAGVMARQETHNNPRAKMPVYVGPELGWPHSYGGHPAEFKELIHEARKKMAYLLTHEKVKDPKTGQMVNNPYFEPGITREQALKESKNHIKGCFDTSHMGMWLKNFRPDLPWNKRVEEFNRWYMEEVKKLAKDDIVGSIQLVNSMSAAHGHLPPGQGIFPVVETAREFKRQGYKGFMVSEGHEEEKFEDGRILVETWRALNAPFEAQSHYGPGAQPQGYRDVDSAYIGRQYAPRQMFGSYTPPHGEYKPWSEIPFE